jgi:tRNA-splicing ligase RtcB (3'-phosphate/5'-hydroxy nucleic acid ligase)
MPNMIAPRVLSWATNLDDKTTKQAAKSAELPFIYKHVALMPDAHFGYGATVGSVIPTQGAIIPSAVGVDIGCGMIAAELDLAASDLPDDLSRLHDAIRRAVPAGVGRGHEATATIPDLPSTQSESWWTPRLIKKAGEQFGSLGAGNHFIEVCLDERDRVWIVLHSGSRGVGNELANIHIDGAKDLMKRYFIDLPDPDLAYLVEGTDEFGNYIRDMLWAQEYAMGSRQRMMRLVRDELDRFMGRTVPLLDVINCHHNFTEREHHMGQNVWLTRKGAIRAREGDRGVIPGSMGAASFIVSGCGNTTSFHSCSHGAGRKMSRAQARRELDEQTLIDVMADKAWNNDAHTLLDEDPRAYKDIDEVMAAQSDLVTIDHRLHQILNYKGA